MKKLLVSFGEKDNEGFESFLGKIEMKNLKVWRKQKIKSVWK